MSKVDLVTESRLFLEKQQHGKELKVNNAGKGVCEIRPADSHAEFYDAERWFLRLYRLAEMLKAKIELKASVSSGGRGVRFLGRTPHTPTRHGELSFTSPGELRHWKRNSSGQGNVYAWYFVIRHK